MASTSTPDFTILARRPSERLAIVEHVRATSTLEETDYLEWKSEYDLSTKAGAVLTARQLIGMANRDPAQAERHAEGSAYVLIGVEPGNVRGVPHWDSADIENWLAPYVPDELRYDVQYVGIDGKEVLFFVVDAPRLGDPIHCLQREHQVEEATVGSAGGTERKAKRTFRKGEVFVRHGSKTEPHTPDDLVRLTARAVVAERPTLDVEVLLDASKARAINATVASDEYRDQNLHAWRAKMLGLLPRREPKRAKGPLGLMDISTFDYSAMRLPSRPLGEKRSEEEYKVEVEQHVQAMKAPKAWLQAVAVEWVKERRSVLGVSVRNNTDQNYENAVIELTFMGVTRGNVFAAAGDAARLLRVPKEPEGWGDHLYLRGIGADVYPTTSIAAAARQPDIEEPSTGRVLVRYPELRIRPHTTHEVEPLLLAFAPFMAGKGIPVHWRVTASNTNGHQEGDIEFHLLRLDSGAEPQAAEARART